MVSDNSPDNNGSDFFEDLKNPSQLYENIDQYPQFKRVVKDDFGEITVETVKKGAEKEAEALRNLYTKKPDFKRDEHMLSSEEREWRDAFKFMEELTGEKDIACKNCHKGMAPEADEARLSRDGLLYQKCSKCGEEFIDESHARYRHMRFRKFISDDEERFLDHMGSDGFFWSEESEDIEDKSENIDVEISPELRDEFDIKDSS